MIDGHNAAGGVPIDIKPHVQAIRVAGLAPASTGDWAHVQRFAALHSRLLSFVVRWNAFAELLSLPRLAPDVAQLRTIESIAVTARGAHSLATTHDVHLPVLAEQVFATPPTEDLLGRQADLARVREQLRRHLTRADLAQATASLAALQEKLAGTGGPVSLRLRALVEQALAASTCLPRRSPVTTPPYSARCAGSRARPQTWRRCAPSPARSKGMARPGSRPG